MIPYGSYTYNQEMSRRGREEYQKEFIKKGVGFTRGYLEGRRGNLLNIFSVKYKAAKEALEDMAGGDFYQ